MANRLDAVVHFAGLTDFQPDPRQALHVNVSGAVHAADYAALLPTPRLLHVSTAFVAGNRSGRIPETLEVGVSPNGSRFDPRVEVEDAWRRISTLSERSDRIDVIHARARELGWPNIYTFTKALAEHRLKSRDDIELTILRPSIVESAERFPFAGWNEGINTSGPIVWLMSSWLRRLPAKPDNHFDVVPVDTVARALCVALGDALEDQAAPIVQVASSSRNPLTFGRAVDLNSLSYRRRLKDGDLLERRLKRFLGGVFVDPDRPSFPSNAALRNGARELLELLAEVDVKAWVSARVYEERGPDLERRRKSAVSNLRNLDRTLKRIDEMLRQYRPFIHDNDYVFETEALAEASARLSGEDRDRFGFDIEELCWRSYWMDVHVPGLERWSLPLLRGERVPEDPPFAVEGHGAQDGRLEPFAEGA